MNPPSNRDPVEPAAPLEPAEELLRRGIQSAGLGRTLEAARLFLAVLQRQSDCFEAQCRLGMALADLNQLDDATHCLEAAFRLRPNHPGLSLMLGSVHKRNGRLEAAAECCRREIALAPSNASAHYNLGLTLHSLDRNAEAMDAYERALALRPNYAEALLNQAILFQDQRELETAIARCEQVLLLQPDHAEAHWQLASALLARGQWERGWREYEWRWKIKDFTTPGSVFSQPRWDGSNLAGRRILLHAEQGFGDIIQFIRYAPLIARQGGTVMVGGPRAIAPLIARVPGVSQVTTNRSALPPFDVHAPILSLPALFRTYPGLRAAPRSLTSHRPRLFSPSTRRVTEASRRVWCGRGTPNTRMTGIARCLSRKRARFWNCPG